MRDAVPGVPRRHVPALLQEACRVLLLGGLGVLAACSQQAAPPSAPARAAPRQAAPSVDPEPLSLEINGYNYTDLYIDSFELNGQGGGNLYVSSLTSGGGSSTCCIRWAPGTPGPIDMRVRWTRDRKRWCEQVVPVHMPVPDHPRHAGVHFFPDGHVEVELTEDPPALKLQLERVHPEERKASGNTVHDEQRSRCQDGY